MNRRIFWITTFCAWIVFIGIDFLFHASILEALWKDEIASFKPARELFVLIPVGYLSFLLLTLLVGYVFIRIYKEPPANTEVTSFALTFGLLYAMGNLCALYSFVDIPILHLVLFHVVYFIEICAVVFIFYQSISGKRAKKMIWQSVLAFLSLVIVGIIIQNLGA